MNAPFIINDPPYGTERVYNALRLAHALVKKDSTAQVTLLLRADGGCSPPRAMFCYVAPAWTPGA
jgi:sulfur relay (sulfurtransferase) complex TusBCD TusD component (DsrE family)